MSGMSMDGLDMALVRLQGSDERPHVTLEASTTAAYPEALRERLQRARGPTGPESRALHAELPRTWAEAIRAWLLELGVEPAAITCIGSHGQTLWHRPRTRDCPAATLQVGGGAVLAAELGVPVVADFRSADITAGGEGAPLVPLAEWILHAGDAAGTIACNNLGSISNVTVLPAEREDILAFDTGPANMLIDAFARIHAHAGHEGDIDRDGTLSARGAVNEDVLLTLYVQRARWLAQEPPKSAGYGTSDPAMLLTVPAEQYRDNYLFFAATNWVANFVDIIAPANTAVEVDQMPVNSWAPIGNTGFSVAHVPLSNNGDGSHRVTADKKVGISVYGVQSAGSYWFPGGLDLDILPQ